MAQREYSNGRSQHMAAPRPNGTYSGNPDRAWGHPPEAPEWPGRHTVDTDADDDGFGLWDGKEGRPLRAKIGRQQVYAVDGHRTDGAGPDEGARHIRDPQALGRYIAQVVDEIRPMIFWFCVLAMVSYTIFKNL